MGEYIQARIAFYKDDLTDREGNPRVLSGVGRFRADRLIGTAGGGSPEKTKGGVLTALRHSLNVSADRTFPVSQNDRWRRYGVGYPNSMLVRGRGRKLL